jgi:hypothetical protein
MEERTFRISGRVVDQNNQGVKGLRIEAWDKDRIRNDLVGEYITEGDGTFRIDFQESYFQEVFGDQRPDLFFKVYDNDKLIHSTENSVLWNVETGREVIMIEIPGPHAAGTTSRHPAPATGTITGKVAYGTTGIGEVKVTLRVPGVPRVETTESGGTFKFQEVPLGEWLLEVPPEIDPTKSQIKPPGLPKLKLKNPTFASIEVTVSSTHPVNLQTIGGVPTMWFSENSPGRL